MLQPGAEAAFWDALQQPTWHLQEGRQQDEARHFTAWQDYRQQAEIETKGFGVGIRKTFFPHEGNEELE